MAKLLATQKFNSNSIINVVMLSTFFLSDCNGELICETIQNNFKYFPYATLTKNHSVINEHNKQKLQQKKSPLERLQKLMDFIRTH